MIYGANGYTGELIAREAARRSMRPVLAGRSASAIGLLARELNLESRVFDLANIHLEGVDLVLHCAGPFSQTSRPMVDACLERRTHYLDVTGEIGVFESIFMRDAEARSCGVMLLPGVGFDVVPTDALAVLLARRLPAAEELWLAFDARGGGMSRGTIRTAIEGAGEGGAVRVEGRIVRVPMFHDVRTIPFRRGERIAMAIPWGDVSTAYRSTGIPNIRVYKAVSPRAVTRMKRLQIFYPLLRNSLIRRIAQKIAIRGAGPTTEQRRDGAIDLWGRVARGDAEETMTMTVPEGYTFTVLSALAIVERSLAGGSRAGSFTPSQVFGPELALSIDGVTCA